MKNLHDAGFPLKRSLADPTAYEAPTTRDLTESLQDITFSIYHQGRSRVSWLDPKAEWSVVTKKISAWGDSLDEALTKFYIKLYGNSLRPR